MRSTCDSIEFMDVKNHLVLKQLNYSYSVTDVSALVKVCLENKSQKNRKENAGVRDY